MNLLSALTTLAILWVFVVLLTILWAISKGHKAWLDPTTGAFIMRYSWPARVAGISAGLFGVFAYPCLVTALALNGDNGWCAYSCLGVMVFYSIFGGLTFFLRTNGRRVIVTSASIESQRFGKQVTAIRWDEVTAVRISKGGGLTVRTANYRGIAVAPEMTGMELFIAAMKKHLAPEMYQPALQDLEDYRAGKLSMR